MSSCSPLDPIENGTHEISRLSMLWSLVELILGNGFFTLLFVQGIIALLAASGILNYFETYRRNVTLLRKAKSMLDSYLGVLPDPDVAKPPLLKVNSSLRSVSLLCRNSGKEYLITLPYDSSKISSFRSKRMVLIKREGKKSIEHDVTLPPGVAYTFTADDLGGERLELRSDIDSRVLGSWGKKEIPSF